MKPVIGIIPLFDETKDSIWMLPGYMDGIRLAGGLPIILPLKADMEDIAQVCGICDGFLFTGGHDVDPAMYGAERSDKCGTSNHDRDTLEKKVFDYALRTDLPVLGICRGIQLINVLCGGTLYQDLPTEHDSSIKVEHHMSPPYDVPCHEVTILEDTPLFKELDSLTLLVNSYHHQAVKDLAPSLLPMAVSEDGLIEALYMPDKKFIQAVQWHPEFNFYKDESSRRLFKSFVNSCQTS
ncbi:MAG: gamma-glutamyl-gamma-aminobutyrate hydrolase family protein [Lachnospiraceae bacterium]|nr:gamma-glutamyl-gamma-aminobutyrate hydrolase family protein [Lachnospiraceae bacterium]